LTSGTRKGNDSTRYRKSGRGHWCRLRGNWHGTLPPPVTCPHFVPSIVPGASIKMPRGPGDPIIPMPIPPPPPLEPPNPWNKKFFTLLGPRHGLILFQSLISNLQLISIATLKFVTFPLVDMGMSGSCQRRRGMIL